MAEFETSGHVYRTDKMNVREQLHLLRGLGPLLGPIVQMALATGNTGVHAVERQVAFMVPFFEAFNKMEEDDVDVLVNRCFAVTHRREGGNGSAVWGPPLYSKTGGRFQYDDIDLGELTLICWNVIQENLGGFFAIGQASPATNIVTQLPTGSPG
jgi:hypothetical protein